MNRFTLQLRTGPAWPGPQEARRILNREIAWDRGRLRLVSTATADNQIVYIELESSLQRRVLEQFFQDLAPLVDARVVTLGWGWLVSDFFQRQDGKDTACVHFGPRWGRVLRCIILYPLSASIPLLLLISFYQGVWTPALVILAVVSIFLLTDLVYQVRAVECEPEGLVIFYWLRPPTRLAWTDICGMRELDQYGRWAVLRCCRRRIRTIQLPVARGAMGLHHSDLLLATIVNYASLLKVGSTWWGWGTVYRRFDVR
ncbi:MAG: hypothetical protein GYB68_11680 [Chloroflexi bacterium]|nr:hypothetical protein [Chloroflexota bacterium]